MPARVPSQRGVKEGKLMSFSPEAHREYPGCFAKHTERFHSNPEKAFQRRQCARCKCLDVVTDQAVSLVTTRTRKINPASA